MPYDPKIHHRRSIRLADLSPNVHLDAFVVMPDHIHGIIVLSDPVGATHPKQTQAMDGEVVPPEKRRVRSDGPPRNYSRHLSLGVIIGQFKSRVSKRLKPTLAVWQRNYYEHIIRSQDEMDQIRMYISDNPSRWKDELDQGV